jgi:hypothetical protein
MRFRRLFTAALAVVAAAVMAVVAVPQPAAADDPATLVLYWIRCQDETGESGSDEIRVDIESQYAGYFNDFDATERRYFIPGSWSRRPFVGDIMTVAVWELDPVGGDDFQGSFTVNRNLVNTGEHEGYAFLDGQYIVRYLVIPG